MLKCENYAVATDEYYVQHKSNGVDELHFEISTHDPVYSIIDLESRIVETTENQQYVVRKISGNGDSADIGCQLDLTDWQSSIYLGFAHEYAEQKMLQTVLPSGWEIENQISTSKKRKIEMDGPTALEVAMQMNKTFGCCFRFYTASKRVAILYPEERKLSNAYVCDQVNLRAAPDYKGSSNELYTRLYAYGKDGLSFADINGGKAYVENLTYTDKIICSYWKDYRYTDKASLLADAKKKVDEASHPVRSWTLDVIDLQRINSQKWKDMSLDLFAVIKLIDPYKHTGYTVQVMETKVYPHYPEKNEVTISTRQSTQRTVRALCAEINSSNSEFAQKLSAMIS